MNLMKLMSTALLLSLSLGAYAQDDDELFDAVAEEDSAEVFVAATPSEERFFQRVHVGFVGTNAKYTNNSFDPKNANRPAGESGSEKYFLMGVSLGWTADINVVKRVPLYLELGATMAFQTGTTTGERYDGRVAAGDGPVCDFKYRVQALSLTIPVSLSYQFRNCFGVKELTLAPFAGVYGRFNLMAKRKQTKTETEYGVSTPSGQDVIESVTVTSVNKSLMDYEDRGGWMKGRKHTGKLLQVGAQVGVNAFYKHYTFGLSYMHDLTPFASHSSPLGVTSTKTDQGGNLPSSGTGCDMKISTRHNFAVTVGYIF